MGLGSAKELVYFNLEDELKTWDNFSSGSNSQSFIIALSTRIVKEKRIVYDVVMMLSDVGGLADITFLFMTALFKGLCEA